MNDYKKHIRITHLQAEQFNRMLAALREINSYQTVNQMQSNSRRDFGLSPSEAIEMSYENIKEIAKDTAKKIRPIKYDTGRKVPASKVDEVNNSSPDSGGGIRGN